jgi:transcriptional regulator with XRE-family HTH domain
VKDMIKIATILNGLMKKKGIRIAELSKATGVPRTTLNEWSSNRSPKNPMQLRAVANYLGVSIHFLLFGEEDQQEPIQKIMKEEFFNGTFEVNIRRIRQGNED